MNDCTLFCLYSTGNSKTREENQFVFPTVSILHEQGSKFDVHIIDHLHIPDLILKLCVFYRSYFPYGGQNCTCSRKGKGKDKEFE